MAARQSPAGAVALPRDASLHSLHVGRHLPPHGIAERRDGVVWCLPDGFWTSRDAMPSHIEPGMRVQHPDRPDWGDGQVQSVIGDRVTVNFAEAGKVLINAAVVELTILEDERPGQG